MRLLLLNMKQLLRNSRKLKTKIFQKILKRNLMLLLKLQNLNLMNLRKNIKIGKMMLIKLQNLIQNLKMLIKILTRMMIQKMLIPKQKRAMNLLTLKMLKQLKQIYPLLFLKKLEIYQYQMMNLIHILKVILKFLVMKWIRLMLIWHIMHYLVMAKKMRNQIQMNQQIQ